MANNKFITPEFRLHHVRQFIESITEPANTIYYVFAGKPTEYIAGDINIDAPNTDIESLTTRVYDEMVFAKQVTSNDAKPLIRRHNWTTGTAYAMYDSQDKNLEDKAFYVVSQEGSIYYVFKCLYNNNGAKSTSQPLFSSTSADDNYYETADKYVWKYMYKIDSTTFSKFSTSDYIPVIPDANVSANAISGQIDVIDVTYGGRFYNNYLEGTFVDEDIRLGGNALRYKITSANTQLIKDYYNNCIIKIKTDPGAGQYRTIVGSALEDGIYVITLNKEFSIDPSGSDYEISPQVFITGDGRHTENAEARALINAAASNTVYKIEMLNKGKDYFLATANVYATSAVRTGNSAVTEAQLRVIYSPKGGHGYDAESELFATRLGISVKFSNNENGEISTDNDVRTIGILKDPRFKDVKLTYDSGVGTFSDGEELIQAKLNRINGTVGIKTTSKNIFSIGTLIALNVVDAGNVFFTNTDIVTVSNVVINAISNVVSNGTSYLVSLPLASAGYGISDTSSPVIFAANSTNGNVRHFNSRIITGLTATANGRSYSNSDYIEISGTGVVVNATLSITTNTIGGILSTTIVNGGKGFACNEIAYVRIDNGGFGYTNGAAVSFSGGGASSTANAFTDALGNVISIVFTSKGLGYTSPPSVTVAGSPTTVGTFTAVLQANGITVKIANSSGGYSNGAKIANAYLQNIDDVLTITTPSLDLDFTSSSYSVWETFPLVTGSPGLYTNSDVVVFVSPSSTHGNAIANVITYGDGSLRTVNVNAGNNFGFNLANTDIEYFVANSTGGFKRYFDSKIVSAAVVSNNSPHYRIRDIRPVNGGTGYNNTRVLRVDIIDGGIGYNSTANNLITFSAGSVTTANAYFSNDSQGKIISVTMSEYGNGYTTAPTVTVNPNANGIGANLSAVLANSITVTSTTGGHGAIIYFSNLSTGAINNTFFIANAGFGYTSPPTLSVSDPIGINFAAVADITGGANNLSNADILYVYGGTANAEGNVIANAHLTNITDLYYSGKSFSLSAQETVPTGLFFKPDGTRMFNIGSTGDDINQYDLSTPWDISTATFVATSTGGTLLQNTPTDLYFTANGTSLYLTRQDTVTAGNGVQRFSLSQAWNVQTISYVANVVTTATVEQPTGVWFKPDGTRMFVSGALQGRVTQFNLSSAWDITTASYAANIAANPEYLTQPQALWLNDDGTLYYVLDNARNNIIQANLTEAWNVETRSSNVLMRATSSLEPTPTGLFVRPDRGKLWVVGSIFDTVYEYTANPSYSISLTSSGKGFNQTNLQIRVANSTSGNVRYLNDIIIKEITVSSGGYEGFAVNSDVVYVTNGNINAIGNAVTNATGGLAQIVLNVSGSGFVNASSLDMFVVNSIGGDIRYFNTNVVSSVNISDGGTGYSNTDYVIISSPNGIAALANIETTSSGAIVSTKLSNRGKGIIPWYVSNVDIINGGIGYSNSDIIRFCGGGGTSANALLLTNTSGGIVRAYVVNGGQNYDCAPDVEIKNSSGGTSSGLGASLVAKVSKPTTLRVYNSNGNPSLGTFADLSLTVKSSPTLIANLIYSSTLGTTESVVTLSEPALLNVEITDSANLTFRSSQSANIAMILADNRTTFDSSISSGDKIYLQTTTQSQVLTVDQVTNSTLLTVTQFPAFTNDAVAISVAKINAKGIVTERGTGVENYVQVTNVQGFFVQSNDIIGVSSRAYSNVIDVSYNGISKTGTNVDQLLVYKVSGGTGDTSLFQEDEVLRGGTDNQTTAYFHSANGTAIRVVKSSGIFYSGNTITGETSGASVQLVADGVYKYEGDFVRGSGDIIYIENIEPISRSNNQSETIKLVLEF